MNLPDHPVLLVVDTFEEVQYRSRDFVQNLWVVLDELQKRLPHLRTVLAGRAPIQTFKTENLLLARLDAEAARGFLEAQGVPGDVAQVVAEQVGGSPLTRSEERRVGEECGA